MSRPSNRAAIADAALRVAERAGVGAITLEAVAAEAGLSKGGVIYHFSTKSALLTGIHELLAEQWEEQMTALLPVPFAESSARDRLVAYIRASAVITTAGEYLFVSDAETTRNNVEPWDAVTARWAPGPPEPDAAGRFSDEAMRMFAAQLAADGLWSHAFVNGIRVDAAVREAAAEQIIAQLDAKLDA